MYMSDVQWGRLFNPILSGSSMCTYSGDSYAMIKPRSTASVSHVMAGIVVTSPEIGTPWLTSASMRAMVPDVFLMSYEILKSSGRHQYSMYPLRWAFWVSGVSYTLATTINSPSSIAAATRGSSHLSSAMATHERPPNNTATIAAAEVRVNAPVVILPIVFSSLLISGGRRPGDFRPAGQVLPHKFSIWAGELFGKSARPSEV